MVDVIGLGELLWDCFPDRRLPGGAPSNVAFHTQQLGLSAAVATRIGADSLGDELLQFLQSQGLSVRLVQRDPVHGTGTVTVTPHAAGTKYVFLENSAWDFLEMTEEWRAAAACARAICFGTLAQRGELSRRTLHEFLAAAGPDCLTVYDVNLRPPFFEREWIHASLRRAKIIKLNDDEVRVMSSLFHLPTSSDAEFATWLLETYHPELVCITRGAAGAIAVSRDELCESSGIAIEVVDTVGAGDAFTAGLIWCRLNHWPVNRTLEFANRLGALVASQPGAMPRLSDEIAELRKDYA